MHLHPLVMRIGLIYILLSIKTRIETLQYRRSPAKSVVFLSYYPLKQGLKHPGTGIHMKPDPNFYPTIH